MSTLVRDSRLAVTYLNNLPEMELWAVTIMTVCLFEPLLHLLQCMELAGGRDIYLQPQRRHSRYRPIGVMIHSESFQSGSETSEISDSARSRNISAVVIALEVDHHREFIGY
jgi:hypothetical protein